MFPREHLAIPPHPSEKLEEMAGDRMVWNCGPCEPDCGWRRDWTYMSSNMMKAKEIYTYSTTRKQKKKVVYIISFRLYHILQPIQMYIFALKKLEVAWCCWIYVVSISLKRIYVTFPFLVFPCSSPVVGSQGLVLTTGVSWSDEWQRGTASGPQHKQ